MSITLTALQKQRRDTAANWTAENPTLLAGEIGIEADTGYWKVGDGATAWTSLAYVSGLGSTVATADGGTGQTTYADGELLIGKTDGTLAKSTLTAGTGVTITNGDGSITIDATGTGLPVSGGTLTGALGIVVGSVTAPGLFFSGDTNTGIYSPNADNFAITTGGEQRLLVNSLGNFTIGGANASNAVRFFDVSNTDTGSSAGTALRLISSDAAGTGTASLDITKYKTGDAYISNSEASGSIIISVGAETARFTSDGLLLDNQSDLRFGEATGHGGNWVAFQAPATIASNVTWTLPDADGSTGQVLQTDGLSTLSWVDQESGSYTITTTATSKTLVNRERCTVTAATQTITLPASPSAGDEVAVSIAGTFTDTVIARNGSNIMSLAEDLTVDKAYVSVTLYFVDATRGWRII